MNESERQLRSVIQRAESFSDQNFRLLLEEVLKRGGREAEAAYSQMLTETDLPMPIRMNLVRVCGYVQTPDFLIRLKRIIEEELNIHLRKEAIIAVAKYNDKRALNILNSALARVQDGLLQTTLAGEIHRIKQNNPLLAMLPRFQEGSRNPKAFAITVQVLKRILVPADALTFVNYLDSQDPSIQAAAFEILCACADGEAQEALLARFRQQLPSLDVQAAPECDPLYQLVLNLEKYFQRQPAQIGFWLADLRDLLVRTPDRRVHELILTILGISGEVSALAFIDALYDENEALRAACREALARHPAGVERLIARFRRQLSDRLELLQTLLGSEAGCRFLAGFLAGSDVEVRDFLLQRLTPGNYRFFADLVRGILVGGEPSLQKAALAQIRQNRDFASAAVLLAEDAEEVFHRCSEAYFEALAHLFPAQAFFRLLAKLGQLQLPAKILLRYFRWLDYWLDAEPVVTVPDPAAFRQAFATLTKLGNREINLALLGVLRRLKTFQSETLAVWQDVLNDFSSRLQEGTAAEETAQARKAKGNLRDIGEELARVGDGVRQVEGWLRQPEFDGESLDALFKTQPLALFLRYPAVAERAATVLREGAPAAQTAVLNALSRHRWLAGRLAGPLQALTPDPGWRIGFDFNELLDACRLPWRFQLRFHDPRLLPEVLGQLTELVPDMPAVSEGEIGGNDILIADSPALKALLTESPPATARILVVLKELSDFPAVRVCQPLTLPMPLNLARLCRSLVRDFFN